MRLFLLPISTRRTLIYAQRLNVKTTDQQSWLDKGTTKAANMWAGWEMKESGWQKKVVVYGNQALKRIPFEEWGLKSIPPLSKSKEEADLSAKEKIEVHFPPTLIPETTVLGLVKQLGTEREQFHKSKMLWCFIGMPISAPFALVPIVPNIPFFYLVFRAWSHWRALSGSKHLQHLIGKTLIVPQPSKILDELYSTGETPFAPAPGPGQEHANVHSDVSEERMVLHKSNGSRIAEALGVPELKVELDRAVWQVEKALSAAKELRDEKKELDSSASESKEKK